MMGVDVPVIGDFHYNGHQLLAGEPACAEALAKYRINPGNVGFGRKRDTQFAQLIEFAIRYGKPVRIGANWGSLDQALATRLMDENAPRAEPWEAGARAARGADPLGAGFGRTRGRTRPARGPHRAVVQGQRRAGTDRGVSRPRRALATSRCTWA